MKKVLHFITGLERGGGAENMLLLTLPEFKNTDNRVCVARGRGEIGQRLEERGIKVYYLNIKSILDFGAIKKYKRVIDDFRPDVQVNYLIHADIFGRLFAKKFGVKKVISYIRNRHVKPLFVFLDRLTLSKVDFLLTNSQTVLEIYRKKYKYPKERSASIPNGVQTDISLPDFDKEGFLRGLGAEVNDFVIFNIASLEKQKDHETLFKAIREIKDKGEKNIKLFICGKGEERKRLEFLRKDLELENEIRFLGIRSDIYEIMSVVDIFVLSSRHEGMSNALLEAMNSKKASIVSDISENKELIEDGLNGFVFKTGEALDLASKILYLKDKPKKKEEMGEEAAKRVKEKYNIKEIVNRFDSFLNNYANKRKKIFLVANSLWQPYINLFEAIGKRHKDLDLTLIVGDEQEREENFENYKIKAFRRKKNGILRIIFLHRFLISIIERKKVAIPNVIFLKKLGKYLKKERPDLVMSWLYFNPSSWQSFFACKKMGIPFIPITEKKSFGERKIDRIMSHISFFISRTMFSYASFIFCLTINGFNFAKKYFPIKNKEKIKLFVPGVDFSIHRRRNEYKIEDGKLRLFIVARAVAFKRYIDLFKAVKYLKDNTNLDILLNIRAGGPMEEELKENVNELKIEKIVNFLPPHPYKDMSELFSANDIFVLPSVGEPVGMVVPEAMACGEPAIISDTSGARTFVEDGVNGYVFETFNYRDLAEKILLLADKKRREEFSKRAEESIKEKFDVNILADNFYNLIKDIT